MKTLNRSMRMCNLAWSNSLANKEGKGSLNKLHQIVQPSDKDSIVLLDGFDATVEEVTKWKKAGKIVIGYISVGSSENWRPDIKKWTKEMTTKAMDEWDGERWVNLDNWELLKPIMISRFQMLYQKGFDGYEGDNISVTDQYGKKADRDKYKDKNIAYAKWLANTAHNIGLLAFFKNGGEYQEEAVKYYDAVINEESLKFGEWEPYKAFYNANKPFFIYEYPLYHDTDDEIKLKIKKAQDKIKEKKIQATQVMYITRAGYVNILN